MFRVPLAALIAAFFTSSVAAQTCTPPQVVVMQAIQSVGGAELSEVLTGADGAIILAKFNAIEPVTDFKADGIAVVRAPNVPVVFLVGFFNGCVVFAETVPVALYDAWRGRGA